MHHKVHLLFATGRHCMKVLMCLPAVGLQPAFLYFNRIFGDYHILEAIFIFLELFDLSKNK